MKLDYYLLNTYVPEMDGPALRLYQSWLEQAQAAERFGYDTLWITEHHFRAFGGMIPNPQLLLGACASITTRLRLGTAVSTLALHDPVRVAEDLAMVDNLSGGRVECGFGRGMSTFEYEVFGRDPAVAQESLEEAIRVVEAAWNGSAFRWEGTHYHYPEITVLPPTHQSKPRIWMTANRDPEHFAFIGRQGYHLMTLPWMFPSYEAGRELIEIYRRALTDAGHVVEEYEVLGMLPGHCDPSSATAHESAERAWANWRKLSNIEHPERPDPEFLAYTRMVSDSRGVFGDPKECGAHLERLATDLGLTRAALVQHFGGMSQKEVLNSMELLATEVICP